MKDRLKNASGPSQQLSNDDIASLTGATPGYIQPVTGKQYNDDAGEIVSPSAQAVRNSTGASTHERQGEESKTWHEQTLARLSDTSFTANAARWLGDLSRNDSTGEDKALIEQNIEYLLTGIENPSEYKTELLEANSMKTAQIKRDRILQRQSNERGYAKQSGMATFSSSVAGWLMDPTSVAFAYAGTAVGTLTAARLGVTALGGRAAMFAGGETLMEGIRTAPQLMADPTFKEDQYLTNLALVAAGTGAFSYGGMKIGGMGKGVGDRKLDDSFSDINSTIERHADNYVEQRIVKNAESIKPNNTIPEGVTLRENVNTDVTRSLDTVPQVMPEAKTALPDVPTMTQNMDDMLAGLNLEPAVIDSIKQTISTRPTFQHLREGTEGVLSEAPTTLKQVKDDMDFAWKTIRDNTDSPKANKAFDAYSEYMNDVGNRTGAGNAARDTVNPTQSTDAKVNQAKTIQQPLEDLYKAGVSLGSVTGLLGRASRKGQGGLDLGSLKTSLSESGLANTVQMIAQRGNPMERMVATRLYGPVKAYEDAGGITALTMNPELGSQVQLSKDLKSHTMNFNPGMADRGVEDILHESLHLLTGRKIETGEGITQLTKMFDDMAEILPAGKQNDYAKTDLHEMLSMALTNPEVQSAMRKFGTEEMTGWSKFVESMRDVSGIDGRATSFLDQVLSVVDEMIPQTVYASVDAQMRAAVSGMTTPKQLSDFMDNVAIEMKELVKRIDAQPKNFTEAQHASIRNGVLGLEDSLMAMAEQSLARENPLDKWTQISDLYGTKYKDELAIVSKQYASMTQTAISNQYGFLTESMASRLMRTDSPLAQWYAQTFLETPSGTGGVMAQKNTAAILVEQYSAGYNRKLGMMWEGVMDKHLALNDAAWYEKGAARKSSPNQNRHAKEMSDQIYLEMNARRLGQSSTAPDHIKQFANELTELNNSLYDMQLANKVDGITGDNRMQHYVKQQVMPGAFMDAVDNHGIDAVSGLLTEALSRGGVPSDVAKDMADKLVSTQVAQAQARKSEKFSINGQKGEGDLPSHEELISGLRADGKSEAYIQKVMDSLMEAGSPGYTNRRSYKFDLATEVGGLKMIDLMDSDLVSLTSRYIREASGMSATSKASNGLVKSNYDMDTLIDAMALEAKANGAAVNTRDVRNVFRAMTGQSYDGQMNSNVRKIRDAVSVAGMNGLFESQLAELGMAVSRGGSGITGMAQLMGQKSGKALNSMGMEMAGNQESAIKFFQSLEEVTGLYSDMHIFERRGQHFDAKQQQSSMNFFDKAIDAGTGAKYMPILTYFQSRYTGYGAIRAMENQIAMAGSLQDFAKYARGDDHFTSVARFTDMGFTNPDGSSKFSKYFTDGTVRYNDSGHVQDMNFGQWSAADIESMGVVLNRHAAQVVQKTFAGETAPEMLNPTAQMLMQFKTYPLAGAEKQQGRHMKFADKEAAWGITLNAISSSAARLVRYNSMALALPEERREQYLNSKMDPASLARDSFTYMGVAGMLPQLSEHAQMLGLPSLETTARYSDGGNTGVPVEGWARNYAGGLAGAGNLAMGSGDEQDVARMQAGAPLGTIAYTNLIFGIIRNQMADEAK